MAQRALSDRQYSVPAMEKGLDVLEALALAVVPVSLAELARQLGRTSSELFRTLNALEQRGYIEKDPVSGKYGLTLRLFALAHTHSPVDHLLRAAALPMRALTERIRESCHLSVLDRNRLLVLAQIEGPEKFRFSVEVGATFPPLHTASGRLLLAHLRAEPFQDFRALDPDFRALSPARRQSLLAQIERLRRKGYSIARDETLTGIHDVSVLVGNAHVGVTAALAVTFLTGRGKDDKTRKVLAAARETATSITQALGIAL